MMNIIEERASKEPNRPWILVPRTSDPKDGWKNITYGGGAKAINRVAHRVLDMAGQPQPGEFPTIAYIGPNDIRYIIFMFGAIKAGCQVWLPPYDFLMALLNSGRANTVIIGVVHPT